MTNQISHWTTLGFLEEKRYSNYLMVDAFDQNYDIDNRARSYLDINCGHCHSPEGSASSSGLYLSIDDEEFGIYKKPVAAGRGSGGLSYSIVPGHPEESILLFRMLSNEPDIMMPESGRSLMHIEASDLITEWTSELKCRTRRRSKLEKNHLLMLFRKFMSQKKDIKEKIKRKKSKI